MVTARLLSMDTKPKAPAVPEHEAALLAPAESLAPGRMYATPTHLLVSRYADATELGPALVRIESAFRTHFPHNIFLDLDLLAEHLAWKPRDEIVEAGDLIAELAAQFGGRPIQFRYVHDFLYGFDWQKWVQAAPSEREHIGPFDAVFLRWLLCRAAQLRELIANDDAKYHPIGEDVHRNPFPFSRTTEDERRLYHVLAERGLLPVETYDRKGRARADQPFYKLREAVAEELQVKLRG